MSESTSRFGDLFRRGNSLERRLRAERPMPPEALVTQLTAQIERSAPPARRRSSMRLGLAAAVSAVFLVLLAGFGGLGRAASSASHVALTAAHVVAPVHTSAAAPASTSAGGPPIAPLTSVSAAQFQYGLFTPVCHVLRNGSHTTVYIPTFLVPLWLVVFPNDTVGSCSGPPPPARR
jgi:hypothetical protein